MLLRAAREAAVIVSVTAVVGLMPGCKAGQSPIGQFPNAAPSTNPPQEPPAVAVEHSPQEFEWSNFRWAKGVDLRYRVERWAHAEHSPGQGGPVHESRQGTVRLLSEGRTGSGLQRVALSFEGTPLYRIEFDDAGALRSITEVSNPARLFAVPVVPPAPLIELLWP